jgi:hypothetical protein
MGGGRYARESPRDLARSMERWRSVPGGGGERFAGYGILGLPFASGHLLAFRRMTASSLGLPYTTVWHRDPGGTWTLFGDVEPEQACPRYFGGAFHRVEVEAVELSWAGRLEVSLRVPEARLQWGVRLATDAWTAALSAGGRLLPGALWERERVLSALGRVGGKLLDVGRVSLAGTTPNRQRFWLAPRFMWRVTASAAVLDGEDLGALGPLPEQARMGDFWIPKRGIFAFGETGFEALDPEVPNATENAAIPSSETRERKETQDDKSFCIESTR